VSSCSLARRGCFASWNRMPVATGPCICGTRQLAVSEGLMIFSSAILHRAGDALRAAISGSSSRQRRGPEAEGLRSLQPTFKARRGQKTSSSAPLLAPFRFFCRVSHGHARESRREGKPSSNPRPASCSAWPQRAPSPTRGVIARLKMIKLTKARLRIIDKT
jgi:hypothetical protein